MSNKEQIELNQWHKTLNTKFNQLSDKSKLLIHKAMNLYFAQKNEEINNVQNLKYLTIEELEREIIELRKILINKFTKIYRDNKNDLSQKGLLKIDNKEAIVTRDSKILSLNDSVDSSLAVALIIGAMATSEVKAVVFETSTVKQQIETIIARNNLTAELLEDTARDFIVNGGILLQKSSQSIKSLNAIDIKLMSANGVYKTVKEGSDNLDRYFFLKSRKGKTYLEGNVKSQVSQWINNTFVAKGNNPALFKNKIYDLLLSAKSILNKETEVLCLNKGVIDSFDSALKNMHKYFRNFKISKDLRPIIKDNVIECQNWLSVTFDENTDYDKELVAHQEKQAIKNLMVTYNKSKAEAKRYHKLLKNCD